MKEKLNDAKFPECKFLKISQVKLPQKHFLQVVFTTALVKELTEHLMSDMKLYYSQNVFPLW